MRFTGLLEALNQGNRKGFFVRKTNQCHLNNVFKVQPTLY